MAMVINTNMSALNAVNTLETTGRDKSTAMERLTSGQRINSSADDAAGLAVSDRMSLQIRGTDQAIRNTNDGMSVAQTIDGAAGEMVSMMERMRELGIQSMNETYTDENREQMDLEFQQLKSEIDRVAETTKFNGLQVMANADGFDIQSGWETTADDKIKVETMNMSTAAIGDQFDYTTRTVAAPANFDGDADNDGTADDPSEYRLDVGTDTGTGVADLDVTYGEDVNGVKVLTAEQANEAMAYKINTNETLQDEGYFASVDDDGLLTLRNTKNDVVAADLTDGTTASTATVGALDDGDNFTAAGIDSLDVKSVVNSKLAVDSIDTALTDVADYRAKLGAVQNRMEYTVSNLTNVNENMTGARSQIMDADFAKESAELARTQVLEQAGMSMLSQANQQSQNVLSLLR